MKLKIREATIHDSKILFDWANDPITRGNSFNTDPIKWDNHKTWFKNKLAYSSEKIFLLYENISPVGVVRFERNKETIIGVTVAPEHRGMGLGAEIIKVACERYRADIENNQILAYIKADNLASKRVFEKAGFTFLKSDNYNNQPCEILILRKNVN